MKKHIKEQILVNSIKTNYTPLREREKEKYSFRRKTLVDVANFNIGVIKMKLVRVSLPSDKLDILEELKERIFVEWDISIHNDQTIVTTVIEDNHTTLLLEELKGIGLGKIFGSITLLPVSLNLSSEKKSTIEMRKGISIDEMISNIKNLAEISPTFIILSILAGILASFGLLYDNIIIIIASMIIAPLLGPIALSVLGTMMPSNVHVKKAFRAEFFGLFSNILIGLFIGYIFKLDLGNIPFQISVRTQPGIAEIVFAIISGFAGGIFILRGESANIVGVAVAASLCPPAANIGVLLANQLFPQALGSLILLVLNVISIYASCAIVFWTSRSLVKGGSVSSREFQIITKRYAIRIAFAITILIGIIIAIILLY